MRKLLIIAGLAVMAFLFCREKKSYDISIVEKSVLPAGVDKYMTTVSKNLVSVRENLSECYIAFLDKDPKVTDGKVVMSWNIATSGETSNAAIINSELADSTFTSCLTGKINQVVFNPPPSSAKSIKEEFNFIKKIEGK